MQNLVQIKFLWNSEMAGIIRHYPVMPCGPRAPFTGSVVAAKDRACIFAPDSESTGDSVI